MGVGEVDGQTSLGDLQIEGTTETLGIDLCASTGYMSFSGVSICSNAQAVYKGCLDWLREDAHAPAQQAHVLFTLKYYNTSTSKVILEILQILESILRAGGEVLVEWKFRTEDMDMEDAGAEFSENTMIPFRLEEVKE